MYCAHCGNSIPSDSAFCTQCGKQLQSQSPTVVSGASSSRNAPRTADDDASRRRLLGCLVFSFVAILVFHNLAALPAVAAIILFFYSKQIPFPVAYKLGAIGLLIVATIGAQIFYLRIEPTTDSADQTPAAPPSAAQAQSTVPPGVPAPKFRLFRAKTDEQTTYIVPVNTTDDQLKSLLWLFRQKVRAGEFKEIGISQPTSKQWGKYGYRSGMLVVYRGEKCAHEGYISLAQPEKGNLGPCGYGEHDDAYYQWGIQADANKDEAGIRTKNGNTEVVFDFKDNWQLPAKQ